MFRLSDPQTRQLTEVTPAGRGLLRMYSCGPAGSRRAHIGDLRPYLTADLIRRNAEHRHRLTALTCQNISDVEHPADGGAAGPAAADAFSADCSALNLRPAESSPRSSEWAGLLEEMLARLAEAGWAAPWGTNPPGHGAECAALSLHFLGEVIDIHVGDPLPPHLEQECALANAAAGHEVVRHWVRTGPLWFDGAALAAGHAVYLDDVAGRGLDPLALRLAFLEHGYAERMDMSWDALAAADRTLRRWRGQVAEWAQSPSKPVVAPTAAQVAAAFDDNLDTQAALTALHALEQDGEVAPGAKFETFAQADQLLALDLARDIGRSPA
ncbi:MAG TPA: cysteine--tRNA ligase [Streptosporangiaceae bacterium]